MSTPMPVRAFEYHLVNFRRTWRGNIFTTALNPVLYLVAFGLGVGGLIDAEEAATRFGGATYLEFLGPGLLAVTVMMSAFFESLWPVLGGIRWNGFYFAQAATPLSVRDLVLGHQLFVAFRSALTSSIFLLVLLAFGVVRSPWAFGVIPAAALLGVSFAAPVAAYSIGRESEAGFPAVMRYVAQPFFLLSGSFFPIEQLPTVMAWVARLTPIYHGVALIRALTLGDVRAGSILVHVAFLAAMCAFGIALSLRAYQKPLRP